MSYYRNKRRLIEREMLEANAAQPAVMTMVPEEQWPPLKCSHPRDRVWRSREFLAQLWFHTRSLTFHLSVNRTRIGNDGHWRADISWDELARVKRECGFGEAWMVECYPPDAELVHVANMRHLWLLPKPPPYGWHAGDGPT